MTTYMSRYSIASPPELAPVKTPRPVPEPWRFRADVEGLRAVAILLVVGCDAGVVRGGFAGVDIFLVISGFLITGQLYRQLDKTGRISLRTFYAARMTRLLPAATVTIVATLVAAWHWMPPAALRAVSLDALAAAAYAMNYRLALQGQEPSPFQHFWSLAVTEQFYLFWPLVLILVSLVWLRRRPSGRCIAISLTTLTVASFALAVHQAQADLPLAYFGLSARIWELGVGALIGLGVRRLVLVNPGFAAFLSWTGLTAIALAALLFTGRTHPGWAMLLPVLGTGLVITGGCAVPSRLLGSRLLQELGPLSYSWYLWHWPVLFLAPYVLGYQPSLLVRVALAVGSLVPAFVSLVAVESRVRLNPALRTRPGRQIAVGLSLTACTVAVAALTLFVPPGLLQSAGTVVAAPTAGTVDAGRLQQLIAAGATVTALPAGLTPSLAAAPIDYPRDGDCLAPVAVKSISYNIGQGCERRGFANGTKIVVLFGDSHAQHWFDALNVVAQQRKWRVVVFVKSNCGAPLGRVTKDDAKTPYTECDQWREEALTRMAQLHPALVVMSSLQRSVGPIGVAGDPDKAWAAAWSATVRRIKAIGAAPVIIQDTPFPRTDVPDCLAAQAIQDCTRKPATAIDSERQQAIRDVAAADAVQVIDTTPWFCTATACPAVIADTLVYRDTNHLTATYSKLLGGVLGKELTP